jgi:hypothetical protein
MNTFNKDLVITGKTLMNTYNLPDVRRPPSSAGTTDWAWLGRDAPTRTMRPRNAIRRERGEPERLSGSNDASVQQRILRAHVALLTRSQRADADYSTSV